VNEAMWSGLPVVASVYAGCARELLPAEQIFDPFDLDAFANVLTLALDGRLPPPDTSRLRTAAEVAEAIVTDLGRVLGTDPTGGGSIPPVSARR
jgi:glycosyltransferase involved in cell wall biosynthesis